MTSTLRQLQLPLLFLTAFVIFALNGLTNEFLLQPVPASSYLVQALRHHLDDAAFALLFAFVGLILLGMFLAVRGERGFLYVSMFSFAASTLLLLEWDEKSLLFGGPADTTYYSLLVKTVLLFLAFCLMDYLYGRGRAGIHRRLRGLSLLLPAVTLMAYAVEAPPGYFFLLNQLFLLEVIAFASIQLVQMGMLLAGGARAAEERWTAGGMFVFILLVAPDLGKDLLQDVFGWNLEAKESHWLRQGWEDTFPWSLLVLVVTFGGLFLRRFAASRHSLELESETRIRMDELLTRLARIHRVEALEEEIVKEGGKLFPRKTFELRKQPVEEDFLETEQIAVIGKWKGERIAVGIGPEPGGPMVEPDERERLTLRLMAKTIAVFYENLALADARLAELEAERGGGESWASRLFLQLGEKERRRLASDLHDGVLQELLHLRRTMGATREELAVGLENIEFQLRETCSELMPAFLAENGIASAVTKLVEKTRLRADFALEFEQQPLGVEPGEEQTIAAYRIVQELIHNAMKHSGAEQVRLRLGPSGSGTGMLIEYEDNGRGLELSSTAGGGLGLQGMRERVRMLDGSLELESESGLGLRVVCHIPCT
ncbi:ATP-binding protein [Paenibacillus sp. GD4]|uniref:sensor histidine kinase n=1 Tax=Paenibacillus sp. GD4 TaxID=3068890 RepID=UPI0027965514|nr:ATP-binding protein [Paenibacillus sp. GD4]MDQ1911768.1 ATP-binding protein [Paenibacillus sp. GD4]